MAAVQCKGHLSAVSTAYLVVSRCCFVVLGSLLWSELKLALNYEKLAGSSNHASGTLEMRSGDLHSSGIIAGLVDFTLYGNIQSMCF